jgi:hypothetical protein
MRAVGAGAKFRVKLTADHPWVIRQLADLHQLAIGGEPAIDHTRLLQQGAIPIIEFIAMAVALMN